MKLSLLGAVWVMAAASASAAAAATPGRVLVVVDRSVPAYREAADGLLAGLGPVASAAETSPVAAGQALRSGGPVRMAVAIGSDARASLAALAADVPVFTALVSLSEAAELAPVAKSAGSLYLDLDLGQVVHELDRLFPSRRRLGVIVRSRKGGVTKLAGRLAQEGFQIVLASSPSQNGLLEAFRELKGKADMVLCLSETGLFDSRTIPPLVRLSLEEQLPVVGFSPSFVKAGAVAGVYPDFVALGTQTAEMVKRALESPGQDAGDETPRRVTSATNPTVLRLLGWK